MVALIIYAYFREGTVWLAIRSFRAGRSQKAQALLDKIAFPDYLSSQNRAYYEMLRGQLAAERNDWGNARVHFQRALERNLRTANDRSLVEASLAEVLLWCGEPAAARQHLEFAQALDHKPAVETAIRKVEELILSEGK